MTGLHVRDVPPELAQRYADQGWWTPDTLGDLLARGLKDNSHVTFRVHSTQRPFTGTFGDVELLARRLAAGLRARGVGPGDVVAFQLPNWVEAAATFWASAFLGAVVVPIVHFYGPKEVGLHPGARQAARLHHRRAVRANDLRPRGLRRRPDRRAWWVRASTRCWTIEPMDGTLAADPASPR